MPRHLLRKKLVKRRQLNRRFCKIQSTSTANTDLNIVTPIQDNYLEQPYTSAYNYSSSIAPVCTPEFELGTSSNEYDSFVENQQIQIMTVDSENVQNVPVSTNISYFTKTPNTLAHELREWALECHPKISHVDKLLNILNRYPLGNTLPKTYETLVGTPRNIVIHKVEPGEYFHLGVEFCLRKILEFYSPTNISDPLKIDVNIDGLPLYKSSNKQFWPILGKLTNISNSEPFLIGIYMGKKKPESVDSYLKYFIEEMITLYESNIIFNNIIYGVKIGKIILDMPAKAFVKCTKSHNGYYSCHFCIQSGMYVKGRMSFPEMNATLRTDESFRNKVHEEHHLDDGKVMSPFERLNINMVEDFPPDYMHLVLLGVQKKLLLTWLSGNLKVRMSGNLQNILSNRLTQIAKTQSRDFSRPSRTVSEIKFWKATEFRTFILYTGPVILENLITPEMHQNFLYLHVAVKICMRADLIKYADIAENLFKHFIDTFEEIYGSELISSNVHNLVHLVSSVKKFGPLDEFATFPFENFLGRIKNLIKKQNQELQQVAKRLYESGGMLTRKKIVKSITLKHENPPGSNSYTTCYDKNTTYVNDDKDGWFLSTSNEIVRIETFLKAPVSPVVKIKGKVVVNTCQAIFETPIDSIKLGMYKTQKIETRAKDYNISDIKSKLFYFCLYNESILTHYFMEM